MLILTEGQAGGLIDAADAFTAVESAFVAIARGDAIMAPPLASRGTDPATRFGAKAGVDLRLGNPGIKIGSYWPDNRRNGLPAHGSTTILIDDATGFPHALVAATRLNALRTAAADAVAVHQLARSDATVIAIIGAGHQAWFDLEAIRRVRPIREVRVWSRDARSAAQFAGRAGEKGLAACACDRQAAVRGADIVVTATAAREALIERGWIGPGTHISAMGADGPGKQELDPALVAEARLFADLPEQALAVGEFQHAAAAGRIGRASVTAIGDVIDGRAAGRGDREAITIFDSSGIAIQDIAVARLAVERARAQGIGVEIDLRDA